METRNTPVLREIIAVLSAELDDAPNALDRLENHFHDRLIVDAGNVATVSAMPNSYGFRSPPMNAPWSLITSPR